MALTQTNNHKFFWAINPQQIVPASGIRYTDSSLTLSLYSGLLTLSPTLVATKNRYLSGASGQRRRCFAGRVRQAVRYR
jgi:hypothetical protein